VLDELSGALTRFDCDRARRPLMQTVAEYPTGDIQDLGWSRKAALAHAELKNVPALQHFRTSSHRPSTSAKNHSGRFGRFCRGRDW
jgi:hypothetical protein